MIDKEVQGREMPDPIQPEKHFYGFDNLRAVFCIAIVAWHTNLQEITKGCELANYIFVHYFALLAVPVFFQISLFLYVYRRNNDPIYFKKRLKTLGFLYLFWLPLNIILPVDGNLEGIFNPATLQAKRDALTYLIGNHTVVYYIFDLMAFVVLAEIMIRIQEKLAFKNFRAAIIIAFVFSLIIMFFGSYITILLRYPLGYANPLNFLPYVFSSFILVDFCRNYSKSSAIGCVALVLVLITCGFGIIEYKALSARSAYLEYNYFTYARVSLVSAAMALLILFTAIQKVPNKVILSISNASLGIYMLHTIVIHYATKMFKSFSITIFFMSVLLLSYVTTVVLRMVSEKNWKIV